MCLIVFAWRMKEYAPLIAAGNRDEYYARPAKPAGWWDDAPDVFAGRDLSAGGTWLGVTRSGRFAAVTNIRTPSQIKPGAPSRGQLAAGFLTAKLSAEEYARELADSGADYQPFHLLVCDGIDLVWRSNRWTDDPRNGAPLAPGLYGLSNGEFDAPWPKVVKSKERFAQLLARNASDDAYLDMLSDRAVAADEQLPHTGVPLERERMLSSVCIVSPDYGTRVSSLVRLESGKLPLLVERKIR